MRGFFKASNREARRSGFSLVEITIALGILAFALVGIMGLFPVAMKSATESQRETRATFIAGSLIGELQANSPTNTFLVANTNWAENASGRVPVNLSANSTHYIAFDSEGNPIGSNPNNDPMGNAAYLATVRVAVQPAPLTNLSRVEVWVEAPASAPTNTRSRYPFVTLLPNR
jgi:uncharacterized protein (TIGR02598 family)